MSRASSPTPEEPAGSEPPLTSAAVRSLMRDELSAALREFRHPPVSGTPAAPPPALHGTSVSGEWAPGEGVR